MDEVTIVGAGFSALVARSLVDGPARVVSCETVPRGVSRRRNLEINKTLAESARSYGTLELDTFGATLHDRLIPGGNSKIWGGFVRTNDLPESLLKKLFARGVCLAELNLKVTGSCASLPLVCQWQDNRGNILDASKALGERESSYLVRFYREGEHLSLVLDDGVNTSVVHTKKLILAVGVVQLLDLMYRSGFFVEGDEVSLTEFEYRLGWRLTLRPELFEASALTIRYQLARALLHYLGVQSASNLLRLLRWVPLYVEQVFGPTRGEANFKLSEGRIVSLPLNPPNFGDSIHYNNLRVNGEPIDTLLSRVSERVLGVGMPFVSQQSPGPISNDIVLNAYKKLNATEVKV